MFYHLQNIYMIYVWYRSYIYVDILFPVLKKHILFYIELK